MNWNYFFFCEFPTIFLRVLERQCNRSASLRISFQNNHAAEEQLRIRSFETTTCSVATNLAAKGNNRQTCLFFYCVRYRTAMQDIKRNRSVILLLLDRH